MKNLLTPIFLAIGGIAGSAITHNGYPSEIGIAVSVGMMFGGYLTMVMPTILSKL